MWGKEWHLMSWKIWWISLRTSTSTCWQTVRSWETQRLGRPPGAVGRPALASQKKTLGIFKNEEYVWNCMKFMEVYEYVWICCVHFRCCFCIVWRKMRTTTMPCSSQNCILLAGGSVQPSKVRFPVKSEWFRELSAWPTLGWFDVRWE